jgi:hypothetical protein
MPNSYVVTTSLVGLGLLLMALLLSSTRVAASSSPEECAVAEDDDASLTTATASSSDGSEQQKQQQQQQEKEEDHHHHQQRILFLSYEFAPPLFSGNGVYSRTIVRALLETLPSAAVLAVCGRPPAASASPPPSSEELLCGSNGNGGGEGCAPGVASRLRVETVPLSRWGSIDRSADYRGFASNAPPRVTEAVKSFRPTTVVFVDWTGAMLAKTLFGERLGSGGSGGGGSEEQLLPRAVYLNFRVFSANQVSGGSGSGSDGGDSDRAWYAEREADAVRLSDVSVALCPNDVNELRSLLTPESSSSSSSSSSSFLVLNPPLREDIRTIATTTRTTTMNAPSEGSGGRRKWLLCCSRLSPEKNVELFVAAMGAVGRERLERLGVVPLLVGSGRNDAAGTAYATKLREGLVEATGGVKDHLPCLHQLLLCSSIEFRPLTF